MSRRFVVTVEAAAMADDKRAEAVQQVLQQVCDVFISPSQFDNLGLHAKGCDVNCDGSGGIPGGLVFMQCFDMLPSPTVFCRGDHVSFKIDGEYTRGIVLAVEPTGADSNLVCGYYKDRDLFASIMLPLDEVVKIA